MSTDFSPVNAADIQQVAVIGAGTMGRGIAISFANAGIQVTLVDLNEDVRQQALTYIQGIYAGMVKRERITQADADACLARFSLSGDYQDIADVQLAIEAVYENIDLKKKIFQQLDSTLNPAAILATNTSYLDVDAIAAVTSRPQQVLGLHFFSPAHIMKLLEIVRAEKTAPAVIQLAEDLGSRLNKVAVVAGNCHGFIGNRMLEPYVFEARRLLLEGALPAQVDNALQAWGMAMGPFRMYDVVGIDLEWRARQLSGTVLEAGSDAEMNVRIDNRLCELERFGQKSGQGYYRYEAGSREALVDDSVNALVIEESGKAGFERRDISDDEIVSRCILALVNEGAKILDEGIARNSADIDKVYLNGYGFPKERGGPMAWADSEGLVGVLADMKDLQQANGNRWEPAALLKSLAADGQTFSSIKN